MFASIFENLDLVNIYKKNDFGEKFWISRFWSKLSKTSILVNIFGKTKFGVNFSENLDFG